MNIHAQIANQLINMREAAGLTQGEVARRAGLTQATIHRAESNGPTTIKTLSKIAHVYLFCVCIKFDPTVDTSPPAVKSNTNDATQTMERGEP